MTFLFLLLAIPALVQGMNTEQATYQSSLGASSSNRILGLNLVNRFFVPYGPDVTQSTNETVFTGFGFGMDAVDAVGYDYVEKYIYAKSDYGAFITVIDYSSFPAKVTPYSLTLTSWNSGLHDIAICPQQGFFFVSIGDVNKVLVFSTVKRSSPATPKLINVLDTGLATDMIGVNPDCTILAVAIANDNMAPGVNLVTNFGTANPPTMRKVNFFESFITDEYLTSRNAPQPLTLDAMTYWDVYSDIADQLNWTHYRQNYSASWFFDPQWFAWSMDGTTLYVSLDQNSALMRIDIATASVIAIDGFGLKSYTGNVGVDVVQDGGCPLFVSLPNLYALRGNHGIQLVNVDGVDYLFVANSGNDGGFEAYSEIFSGQDLFNGTQLGPKDFKVGSSQLFGTSSAASAGFNSNCQKGTTEFCSPSTQFSVGTAAVDYSDPTAPVLNKMVLFGGRGISAFQMPSGTSSNPISFVWDSGMDFEKEGCAAAPWAHNAFVDETYSPINGIYYQTHPGDRSAIAINNNPSENGCLNDGNGNPGACPLPHTIDMVSPLESGLQPVALTAGVACDRLFILTAGSSNQDAYLYDASDLQNPQLVQTWNLSPASQLKSPGVAYEDGSLGEVDPEHFIFVPASRSPTGKDGAIIGGIISGTIGFYEFVCANDAPVTRLSPGAKAGISVGAVAGALVVGLVAYLLMRRHSVAKSAADLQVQAPAETKEHADTKEPSEQHTEEEFTDKWLA